MKAYLYCRVSGQGQLTEDGPVRQFEAMHTFAAANDIEVAQEFTEAYTGKELDRPVLQNIIALILENGVRTIIVEKLDRLARDVVTQEMLIRDFQKNKIILLSASPAEQDLCSKDPGRVMLRQILGAVSGYERSMTVFRTKAARDRIRDKGRVPGAKNYSTDPVTNKRCEGQKPYGHHQDKPEEKQTLTLMVALSKHYSPAWIALELNSRGIKPRSGVKWHQNAVRRILKRSA